MPAGPFGLVIAVLFLLVAAPAAAQPPVPTLDGAGAGDATSSPWVELSDAVFSDRAGVTCTYGAVLGASVAALTAVLDLGVTLGIELVAGGAVLGCAAWLAEIAAENFQWHWQNEHPVPARQEGQAVRGPGAVGVTTVFFAPARR